MGCGTASTALELESKYSYYLGVDISEIAIQKARAFISQNLGKAQKTYFAVGDLATFNPGRKFLVIIYRETGQLSYLFRILSQCQQWADGMQIMKASNYDDKYEAQNYFRYPE